MAENTKIEWTTHTFNPWIGCTKVAAGCTHCYAEAFAKRYGKATWGPNGTRVRTSEANWRKPLKWNREAVYSEIDHESESNLGKDLGKYDRPRVFCASLADVFEDWQEEIRDSHGGILHRCQYGHTIPMESVYANGTECDGGCNGTCQPLTMHDLRRDLFALIDATPNLDWLLLTKRPENIRKMWPAQIHQSENWFFDTAEQKRRGLDKAGPHKSTITIGNAARKNVWLGTSVSDQETYDRNAHQLYHNGRDLVPVLFLSGEPLLGPIKLWHDFDGDKTRNWKGCFDLFIAGGESGPGARPCNIEWIRSIVAQCKAAGTACFVKQLGSHCIDDLKTGDVDQFWPQGTMTDQKREHKTHYRMILKDKKGGDMQEWPADLRVREMPEVPHA